MSEHGDFQAVAEETPIEEIYGYTVKPIDVDLGVTMRSTPREQGDTRVTMYKAMPGLYLDTKGRPLPDAVARLAGFDIDGDRRRARTEYEIRLAERAIRQRQIEAEHEIRGRVSDEARSRMAAIPDLPPPAPRPLTLNPVPDSLVTETNANGRPRGTRDYLMVGGSGGFWDVIERDTSVQIASRVITTKAEEILLEAQAKRAEG